MLLSIEKVAFKSCYAFKHSWKSWKKYAYINTKDIFWPGSRVSTLKNETSVWKIKHRIFRSYGYYEYNGLD